MSEVKSNPNPSPKKGITPIFLVTTALVAALYVMLCLPFASFAFGMIQFRLAEVLTVLPAFTPAAIPGVFLGCFLSNILNPQNLGLVDILGGSLTTLLAALLTFFFAKAYRQLLREKYQAPGRALPEGKLWKMRFFRVLALIPPVILNAVIVGSYLPFLLLDHDPTPLELVGSIGSIFLSQTIVIYGIGMPLMLGLEKTRLPFDKLR